MGKYIVVLFWVLVLSLVLLSVPTKCMAKNKVKKEGFHNFFNYNKQYCGSCGWRSKKSCSKCQNCGLCTTANGYTECVPGGPNGPLFRSDCVYWSYGNPYNYYKNALAYPVILTHN
ncbi:hypothetical protein Indivirus_1_209 [Indivirus ILV1]|uniref:Uncharacterized protein n=1 Tax=Indivirus ILV1 TaxID=1977633 RepID=A0A1V0SCZ6_9VIRU|nr:hypothetical protein Indivirus_1_209 [Indivirus ILV1]